MLTVNELNANATMIIQFLYKLIDVWEMFTETSRTQVFKDYFRELEEESIRDNFVIVYELLDEMMDFGYPQITESQLLQE